MSFPSHTPVLLHEVLSALSPQPGQTLLDCTAGLGGHAAAIAPFLKSGAVILNDSDPANLAFAERAVGAANPDATIMPLRGNFADAPRRLQELSLQADLVLADLGFSSNQMDAPARGFSFQRDGPLDMRLDPASPVTAADLVASTPEPDLARLLRDYGEEPAAHRIARKLVEARRAAPISTTGQLADIVRSVVGRRPAGGGGGIDPATRTFQALRIAVNDELGSLSALLAAVERAASHGHPPPRAPVSQGWLKAEARVAVISFHSLEDRLVKQSFASLVSSSRATHLTRKPVEPSESEVADNPRSRSAKLRAIRLA